MRSSIRFACVTCTMLTMLVACSVSTRAANWTGAADPSPPNGVYNNASNWSGNFGIVPGAADTGIFDINSTYTVTFTANQALQHASVRCGEMSWLSDSATVRSFALGRLSVGGVNQTLTIGSSAKPLAVTSSNPIEAGSLITLGNGTIVVDGANSSLDGPSVQLGGSGDFDGTLRYQNGAQGLITGQIDLGTSTYDDSNGLLEISSGADLASGDLALATSPSTATGTINVTGAGSTFMQGGPSNITVGSLSGGAGTINVNTGGSFLTGYGLTTVNATGTINRTDTGVFVVTGNLMLDGGKFISPGGGFHRGAGQSLTVQNGGLFDFKPAIALTYQAGTNGGTLASSGTVAIAGGAVQIDGGVGGAGSSTVNPGVGGTGGLASLTGGTLTLSSTATLSLRGGEGGECVSATLRGGTGGAGGTFRTDVSSVVVNTGASISLQGGLGGANPGFGGGGHGGAGGSFNLTLGSVSIDGGTLQLEGGDGRSVDNHAGGNGGAGGTLKVSGGTFTLNSGTVALVGGSGGSGGSAGSTGSPGQVNIDGGTLTMNGGELTTGSLSLSGGAFNFNGGKLRATTVNGKLIVGGTLAPGITTGTLTVNGGYTQGPAGTLEIELGGTSAGQFDRLVTTASTTLGGALHVVITNGFVPQAGNSFDILDLATFTGTFATLNLPGGGLTWNTSLLYLTGTISAGGVVGDYNKNGTVDAADYVVWRKTLGQTGTGLAADGNFNNIIDAGDYDVFRARFGQTAGSGAGTMANTAVPEPATALLLCLAIPAFIHRRRT